MIRLLITLGLLIAFSFSANSSIYDIASFQPPKINSFQTWNCKPKNAVLSREPLDSCYSRVVGLYEALNSAMDTSSSDYTVYGSFELKMISATRYDINVTATRYLTSISNGHVDTSISYILGGTASSPLTDNNSTCPPDNMPLYSFGFDQNFDGKFDKCFNPIELDNASNCANQVGNVLPVLSNSSNKVCKTDTSTGAKCGYSKQAGDLVYKTDLEMNCFGTHDDEETPDYDGNKELEPDNCTRMGDNSMACRENPAEKCDANGNCEDQCGFVNGQFYCFEQCQGDECDQEEFPETPPVDCAVTPSDASCPQEPDPEFCAANPTHPTCTNNPEPCTGDDCSTGGGGSPQIDLKPVVDELKAINDKLDISTSVKDSTRDLGALDTVFDQDSIDELISKTDTKKTEITEFVNSARAELSSMFQFSASAGGYETITFDFTYGSYSSKIWEYFAANIGLIAAAIMFLAYLIAARVVLS
jgi:hypothetical protein